MKSINQILIELGFYDFTLQTIHLLKDKRCTLHRGSQQLPVVILKAEAFPAQQCVVITVSCRGASLELESTGGSLMLSGREVRLECRTATIVSLKEKR